MSNNLKEAFKIAEQKRIAKEDRAKLKVPLQQLGTGWDNAKILSNFTPKKVANTQMYETHTYGAFRLDIKNRPIDESKVHAFMKEFNAGRFFMKEFPGVVDKNNNHTILDAQHRFEACRRLGLPFYFHYSTELTIDDVPAVQINAGWHVKDYLHSFIKQGINDYVVLHRFIERYQLPTNIAISLLAGVKPGLKKSGFYSGTFRVKDETKAHDQAKLIQEIGAMADGLQRDPKFCGGVVNIMAHPDFDKRRMIKQLKKYSSLLKRQLTTTAYSEKLEDVYNYKLYTENKVRFNISRQ